jgi:Rha family phage regulatory protein
VLQTIDKMRTSSRPEIAAHAGLNFQPSEYVDSTGRRLSMYRMTAKGLSELAMGFSGDDARVVRIRFLNAFEAVASRLASAEKSITKMLLDYERRDLSSKAKGQVGSKLMNERRVEKRELNEEHKTLLTVAQPGLLLN